MAQELEPLPMDSTAIAPAPKAECYLSDWEYQDASIHVTITQSKYKAIRYTCARVQIAHPSQLRAVPARQADDPRAEFSNVDLTTAYGNKICQRVNAVIGINGDFFSNPDHCLVALRQSRQLRNLASGRFDVLVIDHNGDFTVLPRCTQDQYKSYYSGHKKEMYQAFCFGPALVENGKRKTAEYVSGSYMMAEEMTQRMAICQLDTLDYVLITSDGDALLHTWGLTLDEFADLCQRVGKEMSEDGFRVAYNLDGGNSATMYFQRRNLRKQLEYVKINQVERERELSDMICFVTLVKE